MKKIITFFLLLFIALAEPVLAVVIPNDPFYRNQWYLSKIKADLAWEKISASPDMIIAVIDSGVSIDHPDLKGNIWNNKREIPDNNIDDDNNGFIDDYNGWDFVINRPDPNPKVSDNWTEAGVSHGTMVAGIIAARGNNYEGVTGVSWQAQIMPLRVLNDEGAGKISDVVRAIDYAANNGADIINLSFVNFTYSQSVQEAIARAYKKGAIVVAAAGNEQNSGRAYDISKTPIYPACYDGLNNENMVIGVIATDALDQKASFSSYGSRCVDIAAPGISFFSTITPLDENNNLNKFYDGFWSGTSMAAPLVSATLALVAQANSELSRQEIIEIVLNSSDNIDRLNPDYPNQVGAGRLNVLRAVEMAKGKLYSRLGRLILMPIEEGQKSKITSASGDSISSFPWLDKIAPDSSFVFEDINNDGQEEIIIGSAPGEEAEVRIFSLKGDLIKKFPVEYGNNFKGGLNIALVGSTDNVISEIAVTPASSGPSEVKIFDLNGQLKRSFFAASREYRGSLSIAAGDLEGNGDDKIVVAYGAGEEPHVKIFDRYGKIIGAFLAYEKNFRGGVYLTVSNLDGRYNGNKEEIIVSPGFGRNPEVKIFNNYGQVQKKFLAYGKNWHGGVRVSAGDLNNDGLSEIILGAAPGATPHVRVFNYAGQLLESFYAFSSDFAGGVKPGIIKINN